MSKLMNWLWRKFEERFEKKFSELRARQAEEVEKTIKEKLQNGDYNVVRGLR